MFIRETEGGLLSSKSYIVADSNEAAVIDAGVNFRKILGILEEKKLSLKYIILTHAHFDHVFYANELKAATGASVVLHAEDAPVLADARLSGFAIMGIDKKVDEPDMLVKDGDSLFIGQMELKFIHTPGHTPGSMCILAGDNLFSGDTLFWQSVGRTDLGAGDPVKLSRSLKRLMELPDSVKVHPGHGPSTDIGSERRDNPYLSGY